MSPDPQRYLRCFTCGHPVKSYFDHVAIDCEHDMTEEQIAALLLEEAALHAANTTEPRG